MKIYGLIVAICTFVVNGAKFGFSDIGEQVRNLKDIDSIIIYNKAAINESLCDFENNQVAILSHVLTFSKPETIRFLKTFEQYLDFAKIGADLEIDKLAKFFSVVENEEWFKSMANGRFEDARKHEIAIILKEHIKSFKDILLDQYSKGFPGISIVEAIQENFKFAVNVVLIFKDFDVEVIVDELADFVSFVTMKQKKWVKIYGRLRLTDMVTSLTGELEKNCPQLLTKVFSKMKLFPSLHLLEYMNRMLKYEPDTMILKRTIQNKLKVRHSSFKRDSSIIFIIQDIYGPEEFSQFVLLNFPILNLEQLVEMANYEQKIDIAFTLHRIADEKKITINCSTLDHKLIQFASRIRDNNEEFKIAQNWYILKDKAQIQSEMRIYFFKDANHFDYIISPMTNEILFKSLIDPDYIMFDLNYLLSCLEYNSYEAYYRNYKMMSNILGESTFFSLIKKLYENELKTIEGEALLKSHFSKLKFITYRPNLMHQENQWLVKPYFYVFFNSGLNWHHLGIKNNYKYLVFYFMQKLKHLSNDKESMVVHQLAKMIASKNEFDDQVIEMFCSEFPISDPQKFLSHLNENKNFIITEINFILNTFK